MAHDAETKRKARSAYVFQGLSLEAAAQHAAVSFGTASRWKREAKAEGDDWDKARAAKLLSNEGSDAITQAVLQEFVILFKNTIDSIKNDDKASGLAKAEAMSRLSDAYHKTMSAARRGSPEVDKKAVAADVVSMLVDFVSLKFPQHAPVLLDVIVPFGEYLNAKLVQ